MDERKRPYRSKVFRTKCNKTWYSDYKKEHAQRVHQNDQNIKFTAVEDPKQRRLDFFVSNISSTQPNNNATEIENSFEKSCFRVRLQETLCHNSLGALRKTVVPVTLFE